MAEKLPALFREIEQSRRAGRDPADLEKRLWKRHGVTCAMLVLDSTGFTRTTREKGIVHFLSIFLHMRSVVGPVFEAHRCLSWRSAADNLFAEFASPDAALEAAFAAHHAVARERILLTADEPYRVCIGIGCGRVLRGGEEGVFGDEMNLACKLGEDLAEGGETLLTASAYGHLRRRKATIFERRESVISGTSIEFYSARR
jgi:class 3 adenylate cyclase